jgi:hypothetical protein
LWLQELTGGMLAITFRWYVLTLAFISSLVCYNLLKKIIKPSDVILKNFIITATIATLFFMPVSSFGQREHLLMIMILPYVFLIVARLQGVSISFVNALGIGIFAGLGFALKPFFLVTFCFIELYAIYHKRNVFYSLRVESLTIACVLLLYLLSIFYLQPEYIHDILPLVLKYYFPFYKMAWVDIPRVPFVRFILAIFVAYLIFCKIDIYPHLGRILWLAMFGMIIAVLIPRSPSYYHLLPALTFALILSCDYLAQCFIFFKKNRGQVIVLIVALMLFSPLIFDGVRVFYAISYFHERNAEQKLAHFIQTQSKDHSLNCLSLKTLPCFPLVNNIHGNYTGRFPLLWWYEGMKDSDSTNPMAVRKDKNQFLHWLVEDIENPKAKWMIVSDRLLPYLLTDESFRLSLKKYTYRTSIGDNDVYERISEHI